MVHTVEMRERILYKYCVFRLKDGYNVERSARIHWSEDRFKHTLTIAKTTLADAGRYSVKFVNVAGEVSTSADLVVLGKTPTRHTLQ